MPGARVALLPPWLLAAILVAASAAGAAVLGAGGGDIAGAVTGGIVSWGGVFGARRLLARRGHRSFEELPSADWEEDRSFVRQGWIGCLATLAWVAGVVVLAVGIAPLVEGGEYVALVVALPLWTEADARLALWARRRRRRQAEHLRAAAAGDRPAEAGASTVPETIPLRRWKAVLFTVLTALAAPAALGFAVFADTDVVGRVAVGICAPILAFSSFRWAAMARAPWFLRADARGADLLGAGPVPWDEIALVEVNALYGMRWLEIALVDDAAARAAPWWNRAHRLLLQRGGLRGPIGWAAAPAADVLRLVAQHHDEIEVDLGVEGD